MAEVPSLTSVVVKQEETAKRVDDHEARLAAIESWLGWDRAEET